MTRTAPRSKAFAREMLMLIMFAVILLASLGCAQNTETPQQQTPTQVTETPTATNQDAATQGSQVYQYIYVVNSPTRGDAPNGGEFALASESGEQASLASATGADGGQVANAHGRYTQAGISISAPVTTGGTAPTLTGTTTGSASAAQTPSQAQNVAPVQDVRPEITASLPIGIAAPGGIADVQAVTTGRGTTADTEKTSDNQANWQQVKAAADKLEQALAAMEALKPKSTPTTQPGVTPAPVPVPIPESQPAGQ